jgi:hypothetical protein
MRCPRCGETLVAREKCRVCGHELPEVGRTTARQSRQYRDPSKLGERHMLIRMSAEPVELTPGTDFTMGRSSECDLTINSKNVSRNHAMITWTDEGKALLKDLDSNNGCMVNEIQVREKVLDDGDEIRVRPYMLGYRCVQAVGSVQETTEMFASHEETQSMDAAALTGRLADMGVYEVLDTLHYNARTGTLKVFGPHGEGQVGMQGGRAMYAYAGDEVGKKAIMDLLAWREGMFAFTTDLDKKPPNLRAPLPKLLAEYRANLPGMKGAAPAPPPPPPPPPPAAKPQRPPTGKQRRPTGAQPRPAGKQQRPTGKQQRPPTGRKGPPGPGGLRKGPPGTGGLRKGPPGPGGPRKGPPRPSGKTPRPPG